MDQPTLQAVFGQPPRKAIEYLEQKKVMPSEDWWRVQGNAHNQAFVVAHMSRLDLLEDVRQSLLDAQKNGWDLKRWSQEIEPKMKQRGWWGKQELFTEDGQRQVQLGNPYRLKTIYQTNMAQAYEAGRQAVMWDDNPLFPYVMYSAILDNVTRPYHRALHGVVMRKSDPAWSAIAAKNGYKCRCTNIELMQQDVDLNGYKVRNSKDGNFRIENVDVGNGGIAQIARIDFPDLAAFRTDAGWVGRPNRFLTEQLMDKAVQTEPRIASKIVQKALKNNAVANEYNEDVKQWINRVDPSRPRGEIKHVGVFPKQFIDKIKAHAGISLETSVISIHDKDTVAHISKERKKHDQKWFSNIVEHLNQPHFLYWDVKHDNAALVFDLADGEHQYKLIIQLNRQNKGRLDGERVVQTGNLIRTLVVEEASNFEKGQDYIYLDYFDGK